MSSGMHSRAFVRAALIACIACGLAAPAHAQQVNGTPAIEGPKITPSEVGDLRNLPQLPFSAAAAPKPYRPLRRGPPSMKPTTTAPALAPSGPVGGPNPPMPAPTQNFAGVSFFDTCGTSSCGAGWPPDTNGDVGPNHVILAVNDAYAIYNKTGTLLSAFQEDTLWTGSGSNPCNGNSQGDPVVLYDRLADRWILTHFAFGFGPFGPISPFYQCIAVSKSGDPVSGGWWLYPLRLDPGGAGLPPVGAFNDYAKLGVWHDCLYLAANEFDESGSPPTENFLGVAFASFSRADMYSGAPLTWALGYMPYPANDVFTLIPSHNLATTPNAPSPGTPSYFVNESTQFFQFIVRKFTAGANCGAGGTMGAPVGVSQTAYNYNVLEDIPQPNTTNTLDSLVDRLMQKVIYRKVNNVESVWVTHTVGDGDPTDNNPPLTKTGMQWAQINVTGGTVATTPVQQGIHWPDALWRFMGSVAVDGQGNMALGYSTSGPNAPDFPSIKYAGRLATDPLNTLPQTEQVLIAGGGSQTNTCGPGPCHRWGDYSAMSVDPIDDCTFWYINEYYDTQASGTSGNWHTRIGSFKFPTCTSPINGAARTFVSATSAGVDTNPCTTAAPCRTLAHALTLTTPGGEIQVLDSGGYGGLTIDRPITIAASEGVYAGVSVPSGDGIVANPGPSGPVVLRGLTINSTGAGSRGVVQSSGTALYVENCVISNFVEGIHAMPPGASSLFVRNSSLLANATGISAGTTASGSLALEIDNVTFDKSTSAGLQISQLGASGTVRNSAFTSGGSGIIVAPSSGSTGKLEIRKSTFDGNGAAGLSVGSVGATAMVNVASSTFSNNNGVGITAVNSGVAHVADSTVIRNVLGVSPASGGTIVSFGNNRLLNNTTNGSFSSAISLQ